MTEYVTIIGNGKMGRTLATYFEKTGISVQKIGRQVEDILGKIVILAIPYDALEETVALYEDQLDEKILVDISNPLDYQTKTSFLADDQSSSLLLAQKYPELRLIKAMNTNFSSSRMTAGDHPLVLVAGNDASAKETFSAVLQSANFQTLDLGDLNRSKDLEAFARIQLLLLDGGHTSSLASFAL